MATPAEEQVGDLVDPLKKTQSVTADIESASLHALVIGTVLTHELPADVKVGEVAQAIEQTQELKDKLAESAETLADVSAALESEIEKRSKITKQLGSSQEQLGKSQEQLGKSQKQLGKSQEQLGKSQEQVEQLSEQVADLKKP